MNTNPRYRWPEKSDGYSLDFCLRSLGRIVALWAGLSPALAAAGDDLNSRYRNGLLEGPTHFQLGTRPGPMTGTLQQTPSGRRPTDKSLMPSLGLGQGRDR